MTTDRPASLAKAALMGGSLAGLLSAAPLLQSLNACCCALSIAGGVFAAHVLLSDSQGRATSSRCAAAGWLAGLLAGAISVPLGAALARTVRGEARLARDAADLMDELRQLPVDAGSHAESIVRASLGLDFNAWTLVLAVLAGLAFSFFGLLGGVLGHALLARRAARARGAVPAAEPLPLTPPRPPAAPRPQAGPQLSTPSAAAPEVEPPPDTGVLPADELPRWPAPEEPPHRDDDER